MAALAVVRDLREHWAPASAEELEWFETDVLSGFVLARASARLTDGTIRGDVGHLDQIRSWFGRPSLRWFIDDVWGQFDDDHTRPGAPLFPSERKNTDGSARRVGDDALRNGLEHAVEFHLPGWTDRLTPHVLRHFCAYQLYGNGLDLLAFQLAERLRGLAPGIRPEADRWTRVLRDGGPRSLPRQEGTVWLYPNRARPALLEWSDRYDHLREVARDDVRTSIKTLHAPHRRDQLVALRSLFSWTKRNGLLFRNPTSRIKVGQYEYGVLQPLVPAQAGRSVAAATTPATRLILALAAVHAARVAHIGMLMLDNLALKLLLGQLEHRRTGGRAPRTSLSDQQPDRHQDQPRQQPLDQLLDAQPGRDAGAAPRRPAARRGPDPRVRSTSPRRGVRARREDRPRRTQLPAPQQPLPSRLPPTRSPR